MFPYVLKRKSSATFAIARKERSSSPRHPSGHPGNLGHLRRNQRSVRTDRLRLAALRYASHARLRLLGLLTAAPHGVDPLYFGRVRTSGALGVQNVSWEHHT